MVDHRYASTTAVRMLDRGLRSASQERGVSLREIGRRLKYKQPVVLSHMATGRVPIPLDRAHEIAAEVGISPSQFLLAVLEQRHPKVDWGLITGSIDPFATELERTAGKPLSELNSVQQRILRDVVRDPDPEARWLSIPEIAGVELLREVFPQMQRDGLSLGDRQHLRTLAAAFHEAEQEGEE